MSLTTRQWATYNLIKQNSLNGKKTTQREIYENYPDKLFKDGYIWANKDGVNHDNCVTIWSDIEKINFSEEIEKIVISKNYIYWLCENDEEAEKYAQKYFSDGIKKLKRYYRIVGKVKKNGQYKLLSTRGDIIDDESKARDFVETYLRKFDELYDTMMLATKNNGL